MRLTTSRALFAALHFDLDLSKSKLATLVFIRIVREPQLLRLYVTSEGTPQTNASSSNSHRSSGGLRFWIIVRGSGDYSPDLDAILSSGSAPQSRSAPRFLLSKSLSATCSSASPTKVRRTPCASTVSAQSRTTRGTGSYRKVPYSSAPCH